MPVHIKSEPWSDNESGEENEEELNYFPNPNLPADPETQDQNY